MHPEEFYDKYAAEYDHIFQDDQYKSEDKIVFDVVRDYLPITPISRYAPVLDAGCGTGLLLENLLIPPQEYVGLDISAGMLREARKKFPGHLFAQYDIREPLPFPAQYFKLTVCLFGSIGYIQEPLPVLREFTRVTRPGGHLIIMLQAPEYQEKADYIVNLKGESVDPLRTFSPQEGQSLFDRIPTLRTQSRPLQTNGSLDAPVYFHIYISQRIA